MNQTTELVHPTAMIDDGVRLGVRTRIGDHVHIERRVIVGEECTVGGKSFIAAGAVIGNRVVIGTNVHVCGGVTLEDGVLIGAGTAFTNNRFPRATTPDLRMLRAIDDERASNETRIRSGATIGAGCVIGSNLEIGAWSMIEMGSVVPADIPDFHWVMGCPARSVGVVCKCGHLIAKFRELDLANPVIVPCGVCELSYEIDSDRTVRPLTAQQLNSEIFVDQQ
jgi:acetyltransferase-like isoleucine patch superfamily enzyme